MTEHAVVKVACRDCFTNYAQGGMSPWTCTVCGTRWLVMGGEWRRVEVTQTTNQLADMLLAQRELQATSFGLDPAEATLEERVEYIRWNVLACTEELHELLRETSWKPWATESFINDEAALKEWVDAWHFMMNILWAVVGLGAAGDSRVLADQLVDEYFKKKTRNAARQTEGYTGLIGGAEHDALHEDA